MEITNRNQQRARTTFGKSVVQIGKYKINRVKTPTITIISSFTSRKRST